MIPELSQEERELLRTVYTPQPRPKCPICGEELSPQDSKNHVYACPTLMVDPADETHLIDKPGRWFLDKHYVDSRTYFYGEGSPTVIKALDRLEAMESEQVAREQLSEEHTARLLRVSLEICSAFIHRTLRHLWIPKSDPQSAYEYERDMGKAFGALALRAVFLLIKSGVKVDSLSLLKIKTGDGFDGVLDTEQPKDHS